MAHNPAGLVAQALSGLARPTFRLTDDPVGVPGCPGLYAVFASASTWHELGLDDPPGPQPLYVGKAEASLASRDVDTHFRDGKTGHSTVRRTFAALLRTKLDLRAIPRNLARPADHRAHYGLSPEDDGKLSAWMKRRLSLALWKKPVGCVDLGAVEREVIRRWCPPLNLRDNALSKWRPTIAAARKVMRDDVLRHKAKL